MRARRGSALQVMLATVVIGVLGGLAVVSRALGSADALDAIVRAGARPVPTVLRSAAGPSAVTPPGPRPALAP